MEWSTLTQKWLKSLSDESMRVTINPTPKDDKKYKKSEVGRRGCYIM